MSGGKENGVDALSALENHAIGEKERLTYNSTLGSTSFFAVVILCLILPSPWKVVNGEWSPSVWWSLFALFLHGTLIVLSIVLFQCAKVQLIQLWDDFHNKYWRKPVRSQAQDTPVDRMTALNNVLNLQSLRGSLSPIKKSTATARTTLQRSFFDPPVLTTVEQGKEYIQHLQQLRQQEENEQETTSFGTGDMNVTQYGIYDPVGVLPRVYQASGFDPYLQELAFDTEEDPLTTSSNPQVAWAQLEDVGLAMFMHLYVRNIRRLLACHVKDFVEAFLQNAMELSECGVMSDVLFRRVPSQALLGCPSTDTSASPIHMTNVSLAEMLRGLTRHASFVSKTRRVFLFEELWTFEKYLNVGTTTSTLDQQQYVLERLIMLSKDRNLDRYRWNNGAITWNNKPWNDTLPTDAEILMNVFSCLLDNLLPADHEQDRPFWKTYYLAQGPRRPFSTSVRNRLYIVKTVQRPPHFKILAKSAVREIVPCEENVFHAIIVYLHAITRMKAGHLESINLHRLMDQVFTIQK